MFGKRKTFDLNNADMTYKVHYLGNVMTSIMKGDGCVDKAMRILWDNHLKYNGQAGLKMKFTITQGGLRVNTKTSGTTDYYGHRIHYLTSHPLHPKLFVWVYQHVGRNLKTEMRCHAILCKHANDANLIEFLLGERLKRLFDEYKREKKRNQTSRLLTNTFKILPMRKKRLCSTGNYKPPVQRGMCSAPKLDDVKEEDEDSCNNTGYDNLAIDDDDDDDDVTANADQDNSESSHTVDDDDDEYNKLKQLYIINGHHETKLANKEDLSSVYSSYKSSDSGIDGSSEFINELKYNREPSKSCDDQTTVRDTTNNFQTVLPSQSAFIQVSYEFSSDLNKPQLNHDDHKELENMKISYLKRANNNDSITSSFRLRNPFKGLNKTASFTTHTTLKKAREKQERLLNEAHQQKAFDLFLKNFNNNTIADYYAHAQDQENAQSDPDTQNIL
jgi:hypothetical protein